MRSYPIFVRYTDQPNRNHELPLQARSDGEPQAIVNYLTANAHFLPAGGRIKSVAVKNSRGKRRWQVTMQRV